MIKAILIDDEMHCIKTLSILIGDFCPEIEIMDRCLSAKQGIEAIETMKPDLVFLDIEMPVYNAFDLLEHFKEIPFSVVFTTSYDQYAIKAIKFSALDYLLKPIDPKELIAAVHKVQLQKTPPFDEQFQMLLHHVQNKHEGFKKIAVPTFEGFELIPLADLVRCEASNNYSHMYLKCNIKITACRTLKEIEEQLYDFDYFIRVHHSHIVNLNEVTKYVRGVGGYLIMSDGSIVNVSRGKKEILLKKFLPG
jgi:two-component system, LytTR family, response regulator